MFAFIPVVASAQNGKEISIDYTARINLPAQLNETSGLIYWDGKLWSHNDSGGTDSIYAFPIDNARELSQYYTGAPNKDWEAIDQDENYIYIGDFGNNKKIQRQDLRIFRIAKQSLLDNMPVVDTIFFHYPEQTDLSDRPKSENSDFDCEAFVVTDDSIFLFTKQWISKGTALYSLPKTPGTYPANYITTYPIGALVTDAVYLKSKRILALCGYSSTYLSQFIYVFYDFEGNDFLNGKKQKFILNLGLFPHQVEGITTIDGGTYYVTNEYQSVSPQRMHIFDVSTYFKEYLLLPETAGKIQGPQYVCQNNYAVTYTVSPIHQAESYEWTLPEGAQGMSVENSITIRFDTASISGNISVRGINSYGKGGASTFPIQVIPKPATPVITYSPHDRNILQSSAAVGNQWYNHEGIIQGATQQEYEVTGYGEYYVIVTTKGCYSEPSNIITTGCVIEPDFWHMFDPEPLWYPKDAQKLHDLPKKEEKKQRKFLFWRF